MPIINHGHSWAGGGSTAVTSLPVPPPTADQSGTEIGDLLVLVASIGANANPADWTLSVSDDRFTLFRDLDAPLPPDGTPWSQGAVWVGTATHLGDIAITADPAPSEFVTVACIALRARLGENRSASVATSEQSFTMPGLPGRNGGALAVTVARVGLGDSTWTTTGDYVVEFQGAVYARVALGLLDVTASGYVVGPQSVAWSGGGQAYTHSCVVALDPVPVGAPPCQNFPRDDRLGVGSAQNYPPPKSQQGGHRNFGYW